MLNRRFALSAAAVLTGLSAFAVTAPPAVATGRHPGTPATPRANEAPSARFVRGCQRVGAGVAAQRRCQRIALRSFNRARAVEGLGRMSLPKNFAAMSPATQLLVVTNIERVDRGLRPARLSPELDALAARGASHEGDPPLSSRGSAAAGNWAGVGRSTLLADYEWMYDDGPGSANVDCGSGGGGCWGHRENVLGHFAGPLKFGAAWRSDRYFGASIATEWVGGDRGDRTTGPSWHHIARQIPVGVAPRRVVQRPGQTRDIELWASGRGMKLHLAVARGRRIWTIQRRTLRLHAGQERWVALSFHPSTGGVHHGLLIVTGPNTKRAIPLSG